MLQLEEDKNSGTRKALRITVALILIGWLFDIFNTFFGAGSLTNILAPGLKVTENLPRASLYIIGIGVAGFLLMMLLLRWSGETLRDLGFRKEGLSGQLLRGALAGVGIFVLITFLVNPVSESLFPKTPSDSIQGLFTTPLNLFLLFLLSVFKGGFLEEFGRIFELTRFEKTFQKSGLIVALLFSTFTFGLGHAYQGSSGIFSAAINGFLFALVFLRKRSAFEAVSAHATQDLMSLVLGALLYYGK